MTALTQFYSVFYYFLFCFILFGTYIVCVISEVGLARNLIYEHRCTRCHFLSGPSFCLPSPLLSAQDLRDAFYSFGELRSIRIVPGKDFAFVQFTTRQAAEAAAEQLYKVVLIISAFSWSVCCCSATAVALDQS